MAPPPTPHPEATPPTAPPDSQSPQFSGILPLQPRDQAPCSPASVRPSHHQAAFTPSATQSSPAPQQTLSQRHQPLHLSSSASTLPSCGELRHHLNKKPQSPYRWSACHFHGRCPGQHQNCSEKHCPPDGKEGGENGSGGELGTDTTTLEGESIQQVLLPTARAESLPCGVCSWQPCFRGPCYGVWVLCVFSACLTMVREVSKLSGSQQNYVALDQCCHGTFAHSPSKGFT